uniref:Uncharacterized protein n=1 Tax=Anguilla anguilla TaxID=7936 RepID=A0A0E9Q514_ANGAN
MAEPVWRWRREPTPLRTH